MIRVKESSWRFRLGMLFLINIILISIILIFIHGIRLELNISERLQRPSMHHLFGTDMLGRDLLSCLLCGLLLSLAIALSVVLITSTCGLILGFLAGWCGGWFDVGIMRCGDFFLAFPGILLSLLFIAFFGQGLFHLVIALTLGGWVGYARLVRGEVFWIKKQDFISASRGFNASRLHIAFSHIFPLVYPIILTQSVSGIASVILAEASLSFLGLGVDPRLPTLGGMIDAGRGYLFDRPELVLLPGGVLVLLVSGFMLLASGLQQTTGRRSGSY